MWRNGFSNLYDHLVRTQHTVVNWTSGPRCREPSVCGDIFTAGGNARWQQGSRVQCMERKVVVEVRAWRGRGGARQRQLPGGVATSCTRAHTHARTPLHRSIYRIMPAIISVATLPAHATPCHVGRSVKKKQRRDRTPSIWLPRVEEQVLQVQLKRISRPH